MVVQDADYGHTEAEFAELEELSLTSYALSRKPSNWPLARLENWNYASRYLEPPEYFTGSVHVWRNAASDLVSFLIREHGFIYLNVLAEYRTVENAMLDWAERHWAGENKTVDTFAYDHDAGRRSLLEQRGYVNLGPEAYVRIYDLEKTLPEAALPPGFRFATLAESGNYADRIALERSTWNSPVLGEAWFKGKSSSPYYSFDWDLVVLSPDGQQVAASLVWLDTRNRMAEIDPLGTHPDYRRRGLARAIVTESFRRMHASGMRYAYIASAYEGVANKLYASLDPVETYISHHWQRRLQ